jgi:hypothetical protein
MKNTRFGELKDAVCHQIQSQRVRTKSSQIETLASFCKCQFIIRINVTNTHPIQTVKPSSSPTNTI